MKCFQTVAQQPSQSKALLIMKMTTLMMLFFTVNVAANGFGQDRISMRVKKTEISGVLRSIELQTNYRFLYNYDLEDIHDKVSLNVKDAGIGDVMALLLGRTNLLYQLMNDNLIVIKEDPNAPVEVVIRGKVTGEGNAPLAGASVQIKGTNTGTSTNAEGNFSITAADANVTLVISSVGYDAQEVALAGRTDVSVSLTLSTKVMDQVVVIGYGTASKRDLTGSIVKVSGKDVADKPNTNPIASLQGKVAGLTVVNNAVPGSQPDIRIRGTVSMGSVNPLYVVDGIFTNNIDYLNTNDIESIEILKDPSSLAIFGVKGASGVIAITTKKAKAGQVNITLSTSFGIKNLVDKIEMANGDEFRTILNIEAQNALQNNDPNHGNKLKQFIDNELQYWTGNTDWIDEVTRTAKFYNTNLSVTAATDKNKFGMGIGFTNDQGLVKHVAYKRFNFNVSDEYRLFKPVKIGFSIQGSSEKLPYGGSGFLNDGRKTLPIVESGTKPFHLRNPYLSVFDSADYNLYSEVPVIQNTERNPLLVLENNWNKFVDSRLRGVATGYVDISFLRDFNFKATLYADVAYGDNRIYTPVYYAYDPVANNANLFSPFSSVDVKSNSQKAFQQDYILNYKKTLGDHSIAVTAGNTWYQIKYMENKSVSKQVAGDQPIPDNKRFWYATNGFATPSNPTSTQWEYSTLSFLGRVLYNFQNKYYLTASYRKDYASNINEGLENQGQDFWAVGLGWEVTREDFMSNQNIFDFLKLKGSVGVLGNFNTGTIGGYYPFYPGVNATQTVFDVNVVSVFENNYLPDPNLHWETVNAKEIGLEFNMLGNRLHGEISYYDKRTKDLLALLKPVGVLPRLTNSGEISNKGLELSAAWNQKFSNDLSMTVSGNLTTFDNKVVSLNEIIPSDPQYPNQTEAGKPIGYFIGYVVEGLYQSYNDILKSPVSNVSGGPVRPGDFKYKDVNNDGVVDERDKTFIGDPTPDFTYGGSVTVRYKKFDFGIDINGVYGNEIYRWWATSEQKNSVYNYPKYFLEGWTGEGTSNWVPIVDATHLVNRAPSSFGIEDGSYVRIRNLGVGYTFSVEKARIKTARVYINVQNLKTWKNNLGYSPEYGGTAISFGIDGGTAEGALPRIIMGGFNVTF